MLIRALIVLLVVLNLGAAAWWLTRPMPEPVAPADLPAGVARLQLVDEDAPAADLINAVRIVAASAPCSGGLLQPGAVHQ